jgi:hypothetical protein
MAYARFGQVSKHKVSEVYVYGDLRGLLNCMACRLIPRDNWWGTYTTRDPRAMLRHLQEHRQHGHYVPWSATRRLKRES